MITLKLGSTQIELSDRLIWTDEYAYSPVVSAPRIGTTGAVFLHVGKRKSGRPFTLDGVTSNAWISRAVCDQLNEWAAMAGVEFELVVRGAMHIVTFDHSQPPAFTANPIWLLLDGEHTPELKYVPILKFIES